ncbi:MAG: restriction endonuclease [Ignavibacterium sp.]|jgi:5-methylcytosine-specific restriction enzyme subunit McrC|uniref:McrC family protein n=1 Tax=Ignavibacterium sp. TaxID=2651167 RepID=UPI003297BCCF
MPKNKIQRFEYSVIRVGEEGFSDSHFFELVRLNERHNNKYFSIGNKCIYFTQYVGVIQVGNLTIEILPKADIGEGDFNKWQSAFINMLRVSRLLHFYSPTYADLKIRNASLLDIFFETFISEVELLIRLGLVKKYRLTERNAGFLKGKLLFPQNVKYNSIHAERFYTQHQIYDSNNIFNQIITAAVRVLPRVLSNSILLDKVKNILINLQEIDDIRITSDHFDNLVFDRKSNAYKRAILISKMILMNYSPDIVGGQYNILSLLFDMNEVFERYVYYILKDAASEFEYRDVQIKGQVSRKFWNHKTIRPDIIVDLNNGGQADRIIIDTKWKVLKQPYPSDTDLKQMYAYNLHFGAKRSFLLYPKVYDNEYYSGSFYISEGVKGEFENHQCNLYFLDMFDGNSLKKDLGKIILKSLIGEKIKIL